MESVYRVWVQERSGGDSEAASVTGGPTAAQLRRELHTALGTAKWQVSWSPLSFIFEVVLLHVPIAVVPLLNSLVFYSVIGIDPQMCKNFPCLNGH